MDREILIGWYCYQSYYDRGESGNGPMQINSERGKVTYLPIGEEPPGGNGHWRHLLEKCCNGGEWKVSERAVNFYN